MSLQVVSMNRRLLKKQWCLSDTAFERIFMLENVRGDNVEQVKQADLCKLGF